MHGKGVAETSQFFLEGVYNGADKVRFSPKNRSEQGAFSGSVENNFGWSMSAAERKENCLYPISAAFFNIFSLVESARMPVLLIALETVFREMPRASAISCIVTLFAMNMFLSV